jgi:outer membrane immunogenic protein
MKKNMIGALALLAFAANPGFAADLGRPYTKAPPSYQPVEQIYNWTGLYLGGHIGGAFGGGSPSFRNDSRFQAGLQLGADYQFSPNWVLGIEGQYTWLAGKNSVARVNAFDLTRDRKAIGSITGRLGYTWGRGLLYFKGGYAYQDTSYGASTLGAPVAYVLDGNKKNGYTVGAGLEYLWTQNWSSRVEYQYYNFGRTRFVGVSPVGLTATSFDNTVHSIKAGVNYRF